MSKTRLWTAVSTLKPCPLCGNVKGCFYNRDGLGGVCLREVYGVHGYYLYLKLREGLYPGTNDVITLVKEGGVA